jgi:hypothetical protein
MPTLAPTDVRLKGSLHSDWKEEGRFGDRPREYRGGAEALKDEQQRLFSALEIHSPKPASRAASADLSTAVETGVERCKSPAQRVVFVV